MNCWPTTSSSGEATSNCRRGRAIRAEGTAVRRSTVRAAAHRSLPPPQNQESSHVSKGRGCSRDRRGPRVGSGLERPVRRSAANLQWQVARGKATLHLSHASGDSVAPAGQVPDLQHGARSQTGASASGSGAKERSRRDAQSHRRRGASRSQRDGIDEHAMPLPDVYARDGDAWSEWPHAEGPCARQRSGACEVLERTFACGCSSVWMLSKTARVGRRFGMSIH